MKKLLEKIALPAETEQVVIETYNKICNYEEYKKIRKMLEDKIPFAQTREVCCELAKKSGIHEFTVCMAVLVCNADIAKSRYIAKGVSEEVFYETARDLKFKSDICLSYLHIRGIFVFEWFQKFYEGNIYKLGRLQFVPLNKGKDYLAVHIPEDGRLSYDDVWASYRSAYNFFPKTEGNLIAFTCHSYFFLPEYKGTVFKEGSNTYRFIEDYTLLEYEYSDDFVDDWRIFDMKYTGDISALPSNTSLQKAFIEHIKTVGKFGEGIGAILFDGEKIVDATAEEIRKIAMV